MLLQVKYDLGLRSAILATLAEDLKPEQLSHLIASSRSMALACLRQKHQREYLLQLVGLNEEDFAIDCVAELFRRDDRGTFVALKAYFGSMDIGGADDGAVAVYLRRLVSSAVKQGITRALNEVDPGLGKIIRNIKAAVDGLKAYSEIELHFQSCIVPTYSDPLAHLPFIEKEELIARLAEVTAGGEKIPELMAHLATILRPQEQGSRAVPIVRAALVFREVLALRSPHVSAPILIEEHADGDTIRRAVEEACVRVKTQVGRKYIDKNSLTPEELDTYFRAIKTYFLANLDRQEEAPSLQESLSEAGMDVSNEVYRSSHRQKLEYLARLVQKRAKTTFQE